MQTIFAQQTFGDKDDENNGTVYDEFLKDDIEDWLDNKLMTSPDNQTSQNLGRGLGTAAKAFFMKAF